MGRRGPAPEPTDLRILRGNRGRRRIIGQEPAPLQKLPKEAPDFLDENAKAEYSRILPDLEAAGLGTRLDLAAVATYCCAFARYTQAEKALAEAGSVLTTPTGIKYPHPLLKVLRLAAQQMRPLLADLGLMPAARSRIRVTPPAPTSDLQKFLAKHGPRVADHAPGEDEQRSY